MRKSELQLVPHDPLWRSEYEAEKNRIIGAAGDDVRVEHVG
ncbi:MAG: GrpB family protein, partial [Pyrinomonadaceae bacterium]|nr:GrpB family protein [Pyrinomonadaceae bacterium]